MSRFTAGVQAVHPKINVALQLAVMIKESYYYYYYYYYECSLSVQLGTVGLRTVHCSRGTVRHIAYRYWRQLLQLLVVVATNQS